MPRSLTPRETWRAWRSGEFQLAPETPPAAESRVKQVADFLALDRTQLAAALAQGHAIASDALANRVYRGVSLGLPAFVDRLAWKTFAKLFLRDRALKVLRRWNLRLEQTGLDGPLVPRQRKGVDCRFGHFRVEPAARRYPVRWHGIAQKVSAPDGSRPRAAFASQGAPFLRVLRGDVGSRRRAATFGLRRTSG